MNHASWRTGGTKQVIGQPAYCAAPSQRHSVQAILSYGYAVMENQARVKATKIGLDFILGFL